MTDATDATQTIFNELTERAGGLDALSAVDVENVSTIARLTVAMRSAPVADLVKMAETVGRLSAQLPTPEVTDTRTLDMRRLIDAEIIEFDRLHCKALDETVEPWCPPVPRRRRRARYELAASALGKWLDSHPSDWKPSAAECADIRNGIAELLPRSLTVQSLYAGMFAARPGGPPDAAEAKESSHGTSLNPEPAPPPEPFVPAALPDGLAGYDGSNVTPLGLHRFDNRN